MNPLLLEFLGVAFRWLITSLGAYLVAHHVLTTDQEARFADGAMRYLLDHVAIWAPVATGLLLGLWARYKGRLKFLAALQLPAGATEDEAAARATSAMVKAEAFAKVGVLLACVLGGSAVLSMPGCASSAPPPTKVAAVADNATKVQQSATVILHAAQQANALIVPSSGRPLVSDQQLVDVALVVNKIGHLGVDLAHALEDYAAAVKAGGDLIAGRAIVERTVADIGAALLDVGKAIPSGTLQVIDRAVTDVFFALNLIKGSFGL